MAASNSATTELTPGRGTSSTAKSNPAGKSARTGAGADAIDGKTSGQRTAASHSGPEQCPAADGIATAGPARHMIASTVMLTIVPHLLMTRLMFSAIPRQVTRLRTQPQASIALAERARSLQTPLNDPNRGGGHAKRRPSGLRRSGGLRPRERRLSIASPAPSQRSSLAASSRDVTLSPSSHRGARLVSRTKPRRGRPPRRHTKSPL